MYIYATTLAANDHAIARTAAARYAAQAREVSGLDWAAYDHIFATIPEVVTVSATVDTRAELAQAMTAIEASPEAAAAYGELRSVATQRHDAMWYMINPPPGEAAPAPKVISMWLAEVVGSFEKAIGWALDMVSFVEGELDQRYLVGANRTGPAGQLAFMQYADSLAQDEARDDALFGHPETYARLSKPVEKGWMGSGGERIIMERIDRV